MVGPPSPSSPSAPDDERLILLQDGLPQLGLTLHRDRLDLSASDIETALGAALAFKPQTEFCSLGLEESTGIAVILDDDMAALGFVVENDGFHTPGGIGMGSTSEELADVFGDENIVELYDGQSRTGGSVVVVADQDHPEAAPGPGSLHYAFDTDGSGTVRRLRAGYWPYVSYPDYCLPAAVENHYPGWPLEDLR